ncbi:hypothetical protein [Piscirickettsia litoralis]|uniref:NAD(P)-binding domain-containing protein n=1 Tax=Piscirickettsia litoralis TaxID=1891921 RepID=A0ABX3A447_9GAMM|nr:hypothetical protein [Piscirickettsia litoralis]ODN42426.1 hypothetical protein BGC07_05110 [Piscirickettsia litoralis]
MNVKITQSDRYYGEGYQDVKARIPAIENAKKYLNWQPKTDFVTAIQKIVGLSPFLSSHRLLWNA